MPGRIRSIKPEWLLDERMTQCSSDARVLSIALILMADDYGNGRYHRAQMAPHVFPPSGESPEDLVYCYERLEGAMRELVSIRFVGLYMVGSQHYFAIRKWTDHQKVSHPGKPLVPSPPDDLWMVSREAQEQLQKSSCLIGSDLIRSDLIGVDLPARTHECQGQSDAIDASASAHEPEPKDAPLPPPPPPVSTRRRSEVATPIAPPPVAPTLRIAPAPTHSESREPIPPSESIVVAPLASRRQRATDDLRDCPISELAGRCRANPHDASQAGIGTRPELVRVNMAWSRAVGLQPRPLGAYTDRNRVLLALLEAFEIATEEEILRACEQAARDDWCTGRKGSDRDPARKRDVGCLTPKVLRQLLTAAEEHRPTQASQVVLDMLEREKKRMAGAK